MEHQIAHMDLDSFFVSVERLQDSRLDGRPVIIGGQSNRGVVASCSYEARAYGISSAMPMKTARQLCPHGVFIRGDSGLYSKYSNVVTEVISESVPLYEKASIDEFYLDLTGMDRFFGCMKLVGELKHRIHKEVGLPISFGLSTNKTVSKVATGEAKPAGQLQVLRGQEKGFLAPLSVRKIPGVGSETYRTLRGLGIEQIHSIQEMPKELMEKTLGKNGLEIWKKSNGIDPSPVIAWHERKSLSMERTFDRDTIDIVKLKGILTAMTESLAYQLRKGQKLTQCVAVKIRYSDFNTHTLQQRIAYTSADHILIPQVQELFERLYQRRILIRLIGVRFSELVGGGHQMDLFEDRAEMMQLYEAMDRIRNRYGDRSVMRAAGMLAKSIGRNDNPFDGSAPLLLANRRS